MYCDNSGGKIAISAETPVKIWEIATDKILKKLQIHSDSVNCIAISSDGKYAVSGSSNSLKVWEVKSANELRILKDSCKINSVTIPDQKTVISASSDGALEFWEIVSGKKRKTLKWQPDAIMVYEKTVPMNISIKYEKFLKLDWTNNLFEINSYLAKQFGDNKPADIVELRKYADKYNLNIDDLLKDVNFIYQSKKVYYDVHPVKISPDGKFVILQSRDKSLKYDNLKLCDLSNGELRTLCLSLLSIPDMNFSIFSYDAMTKILEFTKECWVMKSIAIHPDGKFFISAHNGLIAVWKFPSFEAIKELPVPSYVNSVVISLNGELFVSASDDGTLSVWKFHTGELLASFSGDQPMTTCAISPDGKTIVAGDKAGKVHFLRLENADAES